MKIIDVAKLRGTERDVDCPNGGFNSLRILLEADGVGFSMTRTYVPIGTPQHWHYKNHLEACYCISGVGILKSAGSDEEHMVHAGMVYVLDKNDDHYFQAVQPVELICIFNPPLKGREVHADDGSYSA